MDRRIFDLEDESCTNFVFQFRNKRTFLKEFKGSFDYIRAYHATKLNSSELEMIRRTGLVQTTPELLKKKALARFIRPSDPVEFRMNVATEIEIHFNSRSLWIENRVFLGLVKEEFESQSYQYLLFGPESLLGLATELRQKFGVNFRQRMVEFGDPYLVEVNVPVAKTRPNSILNIYEYLINHHPECCIVYRHAIEAQLITNISQERNPADIQGFVYC